MKVAIACLLATALIAVSVTNAWAKKPTRTTHHSAAHRHRAHRVYNAQNTQTHVIQHGKTKPGSYTPR